MLGKMNDTSRIVDRLVLKGLVKKSVSAHYKSHVEVFFSAADLSLLAEIDVQSHQLDGILAALMIMK
jgi:DNA-binding MarR family transcriptional regulator